MQRTQQKWREIVRLQEKSGLSVRAYCIRESIALNSFYRWRDKIRSEVGALVPIDETAVGRFIDMGRIDARNVETSICKGHPLEVTLDLGDGFTLTVRRG